MPSIANSARATGEARAAERETRSRGERARAAKRARAAERTRGGAHAWRERSRTGASAQKWRLPFFHYLWRQEDEVLAIGSWRGTIHMTNKLAFSKQRLRSRAAIMRMGESRWQGLEHGRRLIRAFGRRSEQYRQPYCTVFDKLRRRSA